MTFFWFFFQSLLGAKAPEQVIVLESGNGVLEYWQETTKFVSKETLQNVSVESCDFSGVCGLVPKSFYTVTADSLTLATRAVTKALGSAWIKFTFQLSRGVIQKSYGIHAFELPIQRLQKGLRYVQAADGILVQIPGSFNQKIRLCIQVGDEFNGKLSFAPTVTRDLNKMSWDAVYNCLYLESHIQGKVLSRQVAWSGLANQIEMLFDSADRTVVVDGSDVLMPYDAYFVYRCKDSRCNYLLDEDAVPPAGVIDLTNGRVNKDQLSGPNWYAVIGRNDSAFGVSVLRIGKPAVFIQSFEWHYMVALLSAVIICWLVWAAFDCCMKKGR